MNGEMKSSSLSLRVASDSSAAKAARVALGVAHALWRRLARWSERRRQRVHLDQLDAHLLRDIGVTRAQARREASRWFFE